MIQLIPRVQVNIGFASAEDFWSVNDGGVGSKLSSTFGPHIARIPLPWAATVRNLTVMSHDVRTQAIVTTLLKNNSLTALTATLPDNSDGPVQDLANDVSFAALDDFSYRTTNAIGNPSPGDLVGWSVEVESQGNVFGVSPTWGRHAVGTGGQAGALGNGFWTTFDSAAGYSRSSSYSISAVDGTLTHLAMKCYGTPPPVGSSWIGFYILTPAGGSVGVRQDGSPGTVDTRCVIDSTTPLDAQGLAGAVATFSLPIAKGDHVEVAYYRTGALGDFEPNIGVGVGFVPDEDGMFMLTGGSNNSIGYPTGYVWILNRQDETDESLAMAPIGPSGMVARGIYVERGAPGTGSSFVNTVRRNGVNTAISVTLSDAETSGAIDDLYVPYLDGGTIDIQSLGVNSPSSSSRLYWGLKASLPNVGPPEPVGVIGPHIWVDFNRRQPGSP